MTHADLPKSFGPLPSPAVLGESYDAIADALAAAGCCAEISTAGLRKPAREIYPGPDLLARLCARGVPVVLSSDAHEPEHVGFAFDHALRAAAEAGYSELMEFSGRDRRAVPLG
jgi:histidinol-phosphatase (PHP family)